LSSSFRKRVGGDFVRRMYDGGKGGIEAKEKRREEEGERLFEKTEIK
jgi:hypothetical protein